MNESFDVVKKILDSGITGIAEDSRKVQKDFCFFDLTSFSNNNQNFIQQAIQNGAKIIISEKEQDEIPANVDFYQTPNARRILSKLNYLFYKNNIPENLFAVTGTNGKTSIAGICNQLLPLLSNNKVKSASIGTMGIIDGTTGFKAIDSEYSLTTPTNCQIYEILIELKNLSYTHVILEASSCGIDQERVSDLPFKAAIFNNFSQDHLDYHKTMDSYFNAKAKLFSEILPQNALAIVDSNALRSEKIIQICQDRKISLVKYGTENADFTITKISQKSSGQEFSFQNSDLTFNCKTKLIGDFQIKNIMAAICLMHYLKFDLKSIQDSIIKIKPILGRLEKIENHNIFLDYAHTPDAIEKTLENLRKICEGKLICLFGAGGNRDTLKRPKMAMAAQKYADVIFITSDNPRKEDPKKIIDDICNGIDNMEHVQIVIDRKEAIEKAISSMQKEDVLLIAGKGHEKIQVIGQTSFEFDERKIINKTFENLYRYNNAN